MDTQELTRELNTDNGSKIVLAVADGLGGLPREPGGPTELEAAATPNLDKLAALGVCGLTIPVLPGITPGSGPGHLGMFGYDPLKYVIGRGVLEALGIDFDLGPNDVAARGNFCTVGKAGVITDRRAKRIPTETCTRLVEKLRNIRLDGVELFVEPVREHRFVLVLRARGIEGEVNDTDPQVEGRKPLAPEPRNAASEPTAKLLTEFIRQAGEILRAERPANMLTLRGIAKKPPIPSMQDVYGLKAAAIAVYPMYRGLARLVGMTVLEAGANWTEQVQALKQNWAAYDFFYLHYKYTDSKGEDGDFDAKVAHVEKFDAEFGHILALKPDVLIVTGDHSTPAVLKSHSWHPVPVLLAADSCRPDEATKFGERDCLRGGLGRFEAKYLLPLALAHAGRLQKFGA
ncbi:MAG TPA: 2,3-bisphosphoglycerate-independent phosphoglycerate mutase [Phycisphaerae bacterium]|nr:2,3-bisphosphoglycerate-independent phosphoglycerate mutase [Phycisphaerae bacterium]